ncbi:MAG TPA: RNA methyltransferase [Rhizobacter sp.]|nr:RNA methyltransferase [Rhizobacter sp.]
MSDAVKLISSRDNPLLVRLRKLAGDPAAYRKQGEVWVEGDHLCAAFLQRGGAVPQAVITEAAWELPALRELASRADAVAVIPQALMAGLSTLESPAPLAFVVPWRGPGALQTAAATVVLDRLQDAGNVGAVIRSAAAFGFAQVLALKGTAALWSPKVLRAGMGAHFGLNLVEVADEAALAALRVPLLATSSHAAQAIHQVDLPWPCAWVMGHEGQGVSAALLQRCSFALRIPQPGGEESLNVAAAAAVCLYESARQRA